ncbi:ATP-binding protein [Halomonas sp. BC04]|uniref:ATP-binding protein n=1 Tax=Halomonas sp. BC04 TaxID=1403540 RepID=UPI0012DCF326|nr:4Fe-4S dicluster domain-containing protein [Halomonas sp. BC04]
MQKREHCSTEHNRAAPLQRPTLSGIGWVATRCLQPPPHPLDCNRCQAACPADALGFVEEETAQGSSLRLLASDACHGCAQCVAACPTEALISQDVDSLAQDIASGGSDGKVVLRCHRVSSDLSSPHTLHCLRSLGPDRLWELKASATPAELTLLLPESCASCVAAPSHEDSWLPQAQALATVVFTEALPFASASTATLSRRRFLLGDTPSSQPEIPARHAYPEARRNQRLATAAQDIDPGTQLNLPNLVLDQQLCQAHGVCARVCPTTALQVNEAGELAFDPLACLDCGHCITACPEKALTLVAGPRALPWTLRQQATTRCMSCQRDFACMDSAGEDATTECPACRREKELLQDSFRSLFH